MGCGASKGEVVTPVENAGVKSKAGATADGLPSMDLGPNRVKSSKEIEELEKDAAVRLSENYQLGIPISSGIALEVRRCTNIVNGKRRNIKVVKKDALT